MNIKHSDLIAIANTDLAAKLDRLETDKQTDIAKPAQDNDEVDRSIKQEIWRAVYILNLFRYAAGVLLLILSATYAINSNWSFVNKLVHPQLFFACAILLLISAVIFSYISKYKEVEFNVLVTAQFSLDIILVTLLTHSAGSVGSGFILLYFVVVTTGSVVLPRIQALGLASGATVLLFFEHFYSIWSGHLFIQPNYALLAKYSVLMLAASLLVAYMAERIRIAELKRFVPGNETIEDFLVREEINALKTALQRTDGNKTEAAKLLGMTFRSFRYKLTKYGIQ